jgi:hypothetical protein
MTAAMLLIIPGLLLAGEAVPELLMLFVLH